MLKLTLSLALIMAGSLEAQTQGASSSLRGTLVYDQKPIAQATVFIQSLKDEVCVALFNKLSPDSDDKRALKRLQHCVKDEGSVVVDSRGQYQVVPKKSGWYCLHFLWDIQPKPAQPSSFRVGDWIAQFVGQKDFSGKYDAMAQGVPVFFAGTKDVVQDFDYEGPLGQPTSATAHISIPGITGALRLEAGPTAWQSSGREDGKIQLYAMDRRDHLLISAFLQKVDFAATPERCRSEWWPKTAKDAPVERLNLREFQEEEMAIVDYIVPRFRGNAIMQRSLHAYLGTKNLCAEVHLSKTQYNPSDEELFRTVLSSVKLLPESPGENH
jgi:hypothetical protein